MGDGRIRLENSGIELGSDQAQRVFNRATNLQLSEGRPRVEAYRMATKEVFPTVGGSDLLADQLAKHPAAPKQEDDPLHILTKKFEREEGLSYRLAMTKASRQLEAERQAEEAAKPKPAPARICGNCYWLKDMRDGVRETGCYFNPVVEPVDGGRPACGNFILRPQEA